MARRMEPDAAPPGSWRLFVAIEVGPEVRAALRTAQDRCRAARFPLRPVALAGAHLTLRFLGDTESALVPALGATLRTVAAAHGPFALHTAAPGVFPNARRPRVLWLGLDGEVARLLALQRATEAALVDCGMPREDRPFRPHLTVGRLANSPSPPVAQTAALLASLPVTAAPLPVTAIHLIRSLLGPGGARYTTLVTAPLHGSE